MSLVRTMVTGDRVIWALLALAALPGALQPVHLARTVQHAMVFTQVSEEEAQRRVSGPLVTYSRSLKEVLPTHSCLQLVFPLIERNQSQRPFAVSGAAVLAHDLHPRAVRVVSDMREAVLGGACGVHPRYALVWIEPAYPEVAEPLMRELEAFRHAKDVLHVSSQFDRDGNAGHLFMVKDDE